MIGLAIGLVCGAVEFKLLLLLVKRISDGGIPPFWLPLLKIGVLVACLVPCGLLVPDQLYLAGIGVAAVLIVGGFVKFVLGMRRDRRAKTGDGSGD